MGDPLHGILVVDKPTGVTSHDVVSWTRRVLQTRAVGHAGTLDPMATGILVLLIGNATRLSELFMSEGIKRYRTTIQFGTETESLDADGIVVKTDPQSRDADWPSVTAVEQALAGMLGVQQQVPPAVSAIKTGGVASHERVRRGETVLLAARTVELKSATVLRAGTAQCELTIACSKGYYVRSLARDLAYALGTFGHLIALRREMSSGYVLTEALAGSTLRMARSGSVADVALVRAALRPMLDAIRLVQRAEVTEAEVIALRCGRNTPMPGATVTDSGDSPGLRLVTWGDTVVCLAEFDGTQLIPRKVFAT